MDQCETTETLASLKCDILRLIDRFPLKSQPTASTEGSNVEECLRASLSALPTALSPQSETVASTMMHLLKRHLEGEEHPNWCLISSVLKGLSSKYEEWDQIEQYGSLEREEMNWRLHASAVDAFQLAEAIDETTAYPQSQSESSDESDKPWHSQPEADPTETGQFILWGTNRALYRSAYGLTSGEHFYEALLLRDSTLKIGWTTRHYSAGECSRSLAGEASPAKQWTEPLDEQHTVVFEAQELTGTTIGCQLDFTRRAFTFYRNGASIEVPKQVAFFSSNAYYVCADTLTAQSSLYLNFGQVAFKFPPPGRSSLPTEEQIAQYALYPTGRGAMPLFDGQIQPWFRDAKQESVQECAHKVMAGDLSVDTLLLDYYGTLWGQQAFSSRTYNWRWIEAFLAMEDLSREKVNLWASLVEQLVEIHSQNWQDNVDLEEIFLHYSHLSVETPKLQRICILFASFLNFMCSLDGEASLGEAIVSFLLAAFHATDDLLTAMHTLIGLQTLHKKAKGTLMGGGQLSEKLDQWKTRIANKGELGSPLHGQFKLVIAHFEGSLLSTAPPLSPAPTALSPVDASSQAKLSPDCLSLRSDFGWQSARSHLAVDNSLSLAFPAFYFEVTLLTSGPMRIGWATQRWQVESTQLGDSEYSFAYDGATGCIWHQDVQWRVSKATKWQAGDVIGCLLDLTHDEEKFTFYQNGEPIQLNGDIYSRVRKAIEMGPLGKVVYPAYERNDSLRSITPFISMHPYHAALSLAPYQQVTVNFGHTFFRFPPKCLDIWDFQQYSEHLKANKGFKAVKDFNLNSANLVNSILHCESRMITGEVSVLSQQSTTSNASSSELPFTIEDSTVCQTCHKLTNIRLRTLKDCSHLTFCLDCASKNLTCTVCTSEKQEAPFAIEEPSICRMCTQSTQIRLRQLKDCHHFAVCIDCASRNYTCVHCRAASQATPTLSSSTSAKAEMHTCDICKQETSVRLRHLEGCEHFHFCPDCSAKNILCPRCQEALGQTEERPLSSIIIKEPTKCDVCQRKTPLSLRQLVNCSHIKFCLDCSAKDVQCYYCSKMT